MRSNLRNLFVGALIAFWATVTSWSYVYSEHQSVWTPGPIPMRIKLGSGSTLIDGTNYSTSVQAAMQTWNGLLGTVQFVPQIVSPAAQEDNLNDIYFDSTIEGAEFGSGVLAVTLTFTSPSVFELVETDIIFNTAYTWDSYRGNLQAPEDIRRVALHELGHALGLSHPDENGQSVSALMNSVVSDLDSLTADDIAGAQSLYRAPGQTAGPANDNFANATTISLASGSTQVTGSNVYATKEGGEPNHAGEAGGTSAWWKWTAPSSGSITITTQGSKFDTLLGIYTGGAVSSLSTIASNDDKTSGSERFSSVSFSATSGVTYYIAVDGWNFEAGLVVVNLSFTPDVVNVAPSITQHPVNQSVVAGQNAQFSVFASGTPSPTFQWQRLPAGSGTWTDLGNGGSYAGATSATLTVSATTLAMNGDQFRCVASNSQGAVTSNLASLAVTYLAPPVITSQPLPISVPAGADVTISFGSSGTGVFTFRWQAMAPLAGTWTDLTNGGNYSGVTNQLFSISNISSALNGYAYRCIVTNPGGATATNGALLTVLTGDAPKITGFSSITTIGPFSWLLLQPTVAGTRPITYQWYKDGVPLNGYGANTAQYFKSPVTQADVGNYRLVASNSAGVGVSADMAVVWNSSEGTQPWLDTFRQGSIIYFLAASPGRIMRYDLSQETWLPLVILGGSQAVSAFLPTPDGVFVAYGNLLTRRSLDLLTEVPVVTAPGAITSLFAYGGRIYFQANGTVYAYNQATLAAGPSFSPPGPWLSMGGLTRSVRPAIATIGGFGITTRPGVSPNDIIRFGFQGDGSIPFGDDSPYHGNFRIGGRQYLSPDESLVVDKSGVVYRSDNLTYAGSLGIEFDDLTFQADGSLVVLRGRALSRLAAGSYAETGSTTLAAQAYGIFANAGYVYAFGAPADTVSNPGVTRIGAGSFILPPPAASVAPEGARFSVEDVFLDGGVVYLLSNSSHGLVRWDLQSRQFLSTLPLRGSPYFFSFAKGANRYVLAYGDGRLSDIHLATDRVEKQFTNYSVYNSPFGFVAMDELLVMNLRDAGSSGDARMVCDNLGVVRLWSNSGLYSPTALTWQSSTSRLYSKSSFGTNAVYETVPASGVLPFAFTGNNANAVGPFRINDAGTRLLAMSGYVFDANLSTYAQLTNSVADGAWTTNAAYTIRRLNGATQLQKWDGLSFVSVGSQTIPGEALRVFCANDTEIVVLTMLNGYVRFTQLDANLTVTSVTDNGPPPPGSPGFSSQPQAASVPVGSNAGFTVVASGTGPFTYQWQRVLAGGATWANLTNGGSFSGVTTASLMVSGTTLAMSGDQFRCVVTNALGLATSNAASLAVFIPLPEITVSPVSQALTVGSPLNLSVTATSPVSISYQWQKDGVDIAGAIASTYNIASFAPGDAGNYRVVVTNSAGSVTSNVATIVVAVPPVITTHPATQTAYTGGTTSFSVVATSAAPLSYVWRKNGMPISGATALTYTIANTQAADAGSYDVVVTNVAGTVTSNAATLTVNPGAPPLITLQPVNKTVPVQGVTTFTVAATGLPSPSYQWQRLPGGSGTWANVVPGINEFFYGGVTTPTLSLYNSTLIGNNGDQFRCVVSNAVGTATSNVATLTIAASAAPVAVAGGYSSAMFLRNDGTLWAMGGNNAGQLGDGSGVNRTSPVQVATTVAGMATGFEQALFIKQDGTLWAMGDNQLGELGDGSTTNRLSPVQVGTGVVGATSGYRHSLFRKNDGTLWAMGWNANGQLGDGTTTSRTTPVQVATGVMALAAGYQHSLFVKFDGTAWATGNNVFGEFGDGTTISRTTPVQVATGVVDVASFYHSLFLKSDGTLWAAGRNDRGQLGDGSTAQRATPVQLANGVKAIGVGALHSLYLKTDGTVWSVGANDRGQLGDGTTTERHAPVQVASNVVAVSAGLLQSYILKADGSLWAAGANDVGQLGDGTTTDRLAFVQIATGALSLPRNFTNATASSSPAADRVRISWNAALGADHYEVWRNTTNNSSTAVPIATRVYGAYYEDLSGASGVTYYYWVRPVGGEGALGFGSPSAGSYGVPVVAPTITTQPTGVTVAAGANASFTVVASGTASLTYQWRQSGNNLTNGGIVSGATTATLTLTGVTTADAGSYDVVVTNAAGSATSNAASLTVNLLAQTITFGALADRPYSSTPFTLTATSDSGLTVSFAVLSGPATLLTDSLTMTGAGTVIVRALQAGNTVYDAAAPVDRAFVVLGNVVAWQQSKFSPSELLDANISGPNADPDGDGLPNLLEYALGLEPKSGNSTDLPAASVTGSDWTYVYTRPADRTDVTYVVEYSTDLSSWSSVGVTHELVSSAGGVETWQAKYPVASAANCYFRLKVTQ